MKYGQDISTAYRVDPRYLSFCGYGFGFEYLIKFRGSRRAVVASEEGQLVAARVPVPAYCTQGCEIDLELLPEKLKAVLGLVEAVCA